MMKRPLSTQCHLRWLAPWPTSIVSVWPSHLSSQLWPWVLGSANWHWVPACPKQGELGRFYYE